MANFDCRILSIVTYQQTEEDGDEIFLKFQKKKIWPANERFGKLRGAKPPKIDFVIPLEKLEGSYEVELWEYDNIFSSKHIGSFNINPTKIGGPFNSDLKLTSEESAIYSLVWEVVKKEG